MNESGNHPKTKTEAVEAKIKVEIQNRTSTSEELIKAIADEVAITAAKKLARGVNSTVDIRVEAEVCLRVPKKALKKVDVIIVDRKVEVDDGTTSRVWCWL